VVAETKGAHGVMDLEVIETANVPNATVWVQSSARIVEAGVGLRIKMVILTLEEILS
jgi:hypothetical protein